MTNIPHCCLPSPTDRWLGGPLPRQQPNQTHPHPLAINLCSTSDAITGSIPQSDAANGNPPDPSNRLNNFILYSYWSRSSLSFAITNLFFSIHCFSFHKALRLTSVLCHRPTPSHITGHCPSDTYRNHTKPAQNYTSLCDANAEHNPSSLYPCNALPNWT